MWRWPRLLDLRPDALKAAGQVAGLVAAEGAVARQGLVELAEDAPVVEDVAVVLALVEPVDAGDGLEQRVLLHLLVDVEHGCPRRVEAGDELADDDQQLDARVVVAVLLEPVDDVLVVGLLPSCPLPKRSSTSRFHHA